MGQIAAWNKFQELKMILVNVGVHVVLCCSAVHCLVM